MTVEEARKGIIELCKRKQMQILENVEYIDGIPVLSLEAAEVYGKAVEIMIYCENRKKKKPKISFKYLEDL